jgi:hypothetical protein
LYIREGSGQKTVAYRRVTVATKWTVGFGALVFLKILLKINPKRA